MLSSTILKSSVNMRMPVNRESPLRADWNLTAWWRISSPVKMACPMCWCSSYHVLAEMRQMCCLPYRWCKISMSIWFVWRMALILPKMPVSWWFPCFLRLPRLSVRISVFRRWKAESRKLVRVNGTVVLLPTDTNWKKVCCISTRKKPRQSALSLTSMCIPI